MPEGFDPEINRQPYTSCRDAEGWQKLYKNNLQVANYFAKFIDIGFQGSPDGINPDASSPVVPEESELY